MPARAAETNLLFRSSTRASLIRIKGGKQTFAVDQQGYLAVFLLDAYVGYRMASPTVTILAGPAIADASNVGATLKGVAAGVR